MEQQSHSYIELCQPHINLVKSVKLPPPLMVQILYKTVYGKLGYQKGVFGVSDLA